MNMNTGFMVIKVFDKMSNKCVELINSESQFMNIQATYEITMEYTVGN